MVGIGQHGKASGARRQLAQEPEPLCPELPVHETDASYVATRPVEARYEAGLNRVRAGAEYNRNDCGRTFGRECRS